MSSRRKTCSRFCRSPNRKRPKVEVKKLFVVLELKLMSVFLVKHQNPVLSRNLALLGRAHALISSFHMKQGFRKDLFCVGKLFFEARL